MNEKSEQKKWDREEVVILVTEYYRTKYFSSAELAIERQKMSDFLRKREEIRTGALVPDVFRDYAGICLQSSRIRCIDPDTDYCGMQGTKLQKEILQEYLDDPQKLIKEAKQIYKKYDLR